MSHRGSGNLGWAKRAPPEVSSIEQLIIPTYPTFGFAHKESYDSVAMRPRTSKSDSGYAGLLEMLSGVLKNFMDRTCPTWPELEGKPVVGIAVAEEGVGKAVENLRTYCSVCGTRWVGHVTALAKTPEQAHQVCDVLESDIPAKLPKTNVTIHVEPCDCECKQCSASCSK